MNISVRTDYPALPVTMHFTLRLLVELSAPFPSFGGCKVRFSPAVERLRISQLTGYERAPDRYWLLTPRADDDCCRLILELRVAPQFGRRELLLGTVEVVPERQDDAGEPEVVPVTIRLVSPREFSAVPQDQEVAAAALLQVITVLRAQADHLLRCNLRNRAATWLQQRVAALEGVGVVDSRVVSAIEELRTLSLECRAEPHPRG